MNDWADKLKRVIPQMPEIEEKQDDEPLYGEEKNYVPNEINFYSQAKIELNFNASNMGSRNRYTVADGIVQDILSELNSLQNIEIGYEPFIDNDRDAIIIFINNYILLCSTQKDNVLYVYGIEIDKYADIDKIEISNVFEITKGNNVTRKPNPHLRYFYQQLKNNQIEKDDDKPTIWNIKNQTIPLVLNSEKIRPEDKHYFQEYLKSVEYIELYPEKEDTLFFHLNGYTIKALFSRYKNHLYIFNITLAREVQSSFYIKSSVFYIAENQNDVDNRQEDFNIVSLYNEVYKNRVAPKLQECLTNVKDRDIELNFEPPKHHITQEDDQISRIHHQDLKFYYQKDNKTKAVILTDSLKIECTIHRTNIDVKGTSMQDLTIPNIKDFELCLVKGSIFKITKGDQKKRRKDNPHLINFLSKAKKETPKEIPTVVASSKVVNRNNSYNFKNIILSGVAGVGKTHNHLKLINLIEMGVNELEIFDKLQSEDDYFELVSKDRIEFITFHQNYSYEEFIEGFRPSANGGIDIEDGIFKKFSEIAEKDKKKKYYFVIDEINRGNLSKIFGELITLIEESKRDILSVKLPYSKRSFTIPDNLFIIGTMNITDQSISKMDIALRRRFIFVNIKPNSDFVCEIFRDRYLELNRFISEELGDDHLIGHSYFMKCNHENLQFVLDYQIKPLLGDYFYGDDDSLEKVFNILES